MQSCSFGGCARSVVVPRAGAREAPVSRRSAVQAGDAPQQPRSAQTEQDGEQRQARRPRKAGEIGVRSAGIACRQQPVQAGGAEERQRPEAGVELRMPVAQMDQGQRPENHQRGEPGDGQGKEHEGGEQDHRFIFYAVSRIAFDDLDAS